MAKEAVKGLEDHSIAADVQNQQKAIGVQNRLFWSFSSRSAQGDRKYRVDSPVCGLGYNHPFPVYHCERSSSFSFFSQFISLALYGAQFDYLAITRNSS